MWTILNVIWLVLLACAWQSSTVLAGALAFVLIITIPYGNAAYRIALYMVSPLGRAGAPGPFRLV